MTSHAAVVARGMGKTCVAGCNVLTIIDGEDFITLNGNKLHKDQILTIEGTSGRVFIGEVPTVSADFDNEFLEFMSMADKHRKLKVRTNADNPNDTKTALKFGAEGIGLCRTEHMFFEPDRIMAFEK